MQKLYEQQVVKLRNGVIGTFAVLVFLLVSGCQSLSREPLIPQTDDVDVLAIEGRITIKSPVQSFNGGFRFKRVADQYELNLRDRTGFIRINLSGREESSTLTTSLGTKEENIDVNEWLFEEFSLSLPFLELWNCISLDCELIDEANEKKFEQDNQLIEFKYEQWVVSITYADSTESAGSNIPTVREFIIRGDDTEVTLTINSLDSS